MLHCEQQSNSPVWHQLQVIDLNGTVCHCDCIRDISTASNRIALASSLLMAFE